MKRDKPPVKGSVIDKTSPEYLRAEARNCEECSIVVCPELCFNIHVGSMIALGKTINSMGMKGKVHVVDGRREEFKSQAWCGGCKKFRLCKPMNKGFICRHCHEAGQRGVNQYVK